MRRWFNAVGVLAGGVQSEGGVLWVDDEEGVVELVRMEGRLRKREVVLGRAKFDSVSPGRGQSVFHIGDVMVRLLPGDAGEVRAMVLGPRRSEAIRRLSAVALGFLRARARDLEAAAELKGSPREALFRSREGATSESQPGAGAAMEPLSVLLGGEESGFAPSGANKAWAAVYALGLLQEPAPTVEGALGLLVSVTSAEVSPEAAKAGPSKIASELAPLVLAKLALRESDWAD